MNSLYKLEYISLLVSLKNLTLHLKTLSQADDFLILNTFLLDKILIFER